MSQSTPSVTGPAESPFVKELCPNCSDHHVQFDRLAKLGWVSDAELDQVADRYALLKKKDDPSVMKKKFSCYFSKYLFAKHFVRA